MSLADRVHAFKTGQLPGQPSETHVGTTLLISDLAAEYEGKPTVQNLSDATNLLLNELSQRGAVSFGEWTFEKDGDDWTLSMQKIDGISPSAVMNAQAALIEEAADLLAMTAVDSSADTSWCEAVTQWNADRDKPPLDTVTTRIHETEDLPEAVEVARQELLTMLNNARQELIGIQCSGEVHDIACGTLDRLTDWTNEQ